VAQSGHCRRAEPCLLSGVKQTIRFSDFSGFLFLKNNAMIGACVAANQILGHLPAINSDLRKLFIEYGKLSGSLKKCA